MTRELRDERKSSACRTSQRIIAPAASVSLMSAKLTKREGSAQALDVV